MSVRKRMWTTPKGEQKSGWQADYVDAKGKRRRKMFDRKKDADTFLITAAGEVREGVHVADAETVTVAEAGALWLKSGESAGLERSTIDQRRQHLALHIVPLIGDVRLNRITVPWVRSFQEQLLEAGKSPGMARRILVSLGSILADAQDRGLTIRNPVHERSRARSGGRAAERRSKKRLQIGVDIPSPEEIRAILSHVRGRWRPLLMTVIFTGMRASELRGLRWSDVDLAKKLIHVRQRADRYNAMGPPKSEAGDRTIPVPPIVANVLREWSLACPKGDLDLVFPTGAGKIENRGNIINRGLVPAMLAAGVAVDTGKRDASGVPVPVAKYAGLHALRHFYASWCINPVTAGGQGLSAKVVQERLGHSSIAMTLDVYGHLFPRGDIEEEQLAMAAATLVGTQVAHG